MKKLFFLFCIICVCSLSCEKIGTACYDCTVTTRTTVSPNLDGYPQTMTTKTTICDVTSKEANNWEKEQSATSTSDMSGYAITVSMSANCIKK